MMLRAFAVSFVVSLVPFASGVGASPVAVSEPSSVASADAIWTLRAGGPPGASATFGDVLPDLRAQTRGGSARFFRLGKTLLAVCLRPADPAIAASTSRPVAAPSSCGETPSVRLVALAADVRGPLVMERGSLTGFSTMQIGATLPNLLTAIKRDPLFAGKIVVRAKDGTVLLVSVTEKDPPPARYDHGYQMTIFTAYVFRRGRVVAIASQRSEN